MLNKDKIMLMINLALLEDDFGMEITRKGPKKRQYVGGHMFMYFFVESLLFLCAITIIGIVMFMKYGFSMPRSELILIGVAVAILYLICTYLGETIVKYSATKRYDALKEARKIYKRDISQLEKILENDS